MKKVLSMVVLLLVITIVNCNGQPKNDYDIYSNNVVGATKYHFFLEKESVNPYRLTQNMDYLSPNVLSLKVGESATPVFTVNLDNDGSEYRVGVVAENLKGYYSGMGTNTDSVGIVPSTPGGVGLRKK
jgi:hypothetical protein